MSQECVVVVCLFDWCLTARQHRKINLCQLREGETDSGGQGREQHLVFSYEYNASSNLDLLTS